MSHNENTEESGPSLTDMNADECVTDDRCSGLGFTARATAEDKLRLLRDTVEGQTPFGTELANFQRRLRLILDMQ